MRKVIKISFLKSLTHPGKMSTSHLDPKFCFRLLVVTLFVAGASLW
jgi:hypothetical protein